MRGQSRASNFIRHRVRVRVDGFRPERLISEAAAKGLDIRRMNYIDETEVHLSMPMSDYRQLRKLAKSKYKLTIMTEEGVVATANRIKANKLAIVGVCVFVMFYFVQSAFVREVNVIGGKTIPEDELRAVLAEEGLYEGALRNFDCDKIEERLFAEYEQIVWAKVAYQGKYVQVEISEGEVRDKAIPDRTVPCNLAAELDCYIEKVYPYKGKSLVKEGDFVKKGDILISGTIPIENPSYPVDEEKDEIVHYVHAEGKIIARVPYYFSFYIASDSTETDMEAAVRQWAKENVPESAEILNKDFHFEQKKNIIKLYGIIETRQQVGIEKEILIDKRTDIRNEENTD